ncbi:MAG: hypothetical protein JSR99_19000 [Proteobacteria bacterium]|nr:hypothetical protein [Pseudomonadota bacterium]
MDQSQQPKGNFYAPINRYKVQGDEKPIFVGTLTKPGDEAALPFSLWGFKYADKKTGEIKTGYGGSINGIPANIPAAEQIEALLADPTGVDVTVANLTLRPGQIVLFPNGFKDEAPEKDRPDLWGWVNPTDGTPRSSLEFGSSSLKIQSGRIYQARPNILCLASPLEISSPPSMS